MPCQSPKTHITEKQWIEIMLCKSLRMLSVDQIVSIPRIDCYQDTHCWYAEHLERDFTQAWEDNDKKLMDYYSKEIERIGWKIFIEEGFADGRPFLKYIKDFQPEKIFLR